jgi:uroporphyrinogen decarboxylase
MTNRERLLTVIRGEIPDCVPVAPDFSNMIPAKLTGKPFWDLYLYNDPPVWEAYIDCAKHFDIDSLMDGYFPYNPVPPQWQGPPWERFIVDRTPEQLVTQASYVDNGKRVWAPTVDYYRIDDPPITGVDPARLELPAVPSRFEPLEGVKPVDTGPEGLRRIKSLMGDQGLVGTFLTFSCVFSNEDDLFRYVDDPGPFLELAERRVTDVEERFRQIMAQDVKPDFLCVGASGTLIWQTVEMFRELAFPAVKRGIELATAAGIPTHVHSCGPEKNLVKIMAEETDLTVIDPLECPPMGDCDLAELKRLYGDRIVLKGNLHTTEVMLKATPEGVAKAAREAIDAAAHGGRFILSTGDQCGRDTPPENLRALVETARTYGRYDRR